MSYSGIDSEEILKLRALMCTISTDAQTIQNLSALMRTPVDTSTQISIIDLWKNTVQQAKDSTQLLALFYVANDVVQLLKQDNSKLLYKYTFASAIAEAILTIRTKAPEILQKVSRVLQIFQERQVYDNETLSLLHETLTENLSVIQSTILPKLKKDIQKNCLSNNIKRSELKMQNFSDSVSPNKYFNQITRLITPAQSMLTSFEDIIAASQFLKLTCIYARSQHNIDLDAEMVSRIRGYRIPLSARILIADEKLLATYQLILNKNFEIQAGINEKSLRRQREEETVNFLLIPNRHTQYTPISTMKRIELLLKKEWNLRCEKQTTNCSIYWHLMSMLDYLIKRWNRLINISEGIETEVKRRNKTSMYNEASY